MHFNVRHEFVSKQSRGTLKCITCLVSFPLESKHVVNEHHEVRKSHDATREKCLHVMHFNVPLDWLERNSRHSLKAEKSHGCRGLLGRVVFSLCCQLLT